MLSQRPLRIKRYIAAYPPLVVSMRPYLICQWLEGRPFRWWNNFGHDTFFRKRKERKKNGCRFVTQGTQYINIVGRWRQMLLGYVTVFFFFPYIDPHDASMTGDNIKNTVPGFSSFYGHSNNLRNSILERIGWWWIRKISQLFFFLQLTI